MATVPIFISYAREDAADQRHLSLLLRSLNTPKEFVEVLTDDGNEVGEWRPQVIQYIERAKLGVLLLTEHFLASKVCRDELDLLLTRSIPLVPVLVKKCSWEEELPDLARYQFPLEQVPIEETRDRNGAWGSVAQFIRVGVRSLFNERDLGEGASKSQVFDIPRALSCIQTAIRKGTFTPVVGPACYGLKENRSAAAQHLKDRYRRVLANLGSSKEKNYVKSILEANVGNLALSNLSPMRGGENGWSGLLFRFQAAIARVGATASELFSYALASDIRGFTDVQAFCVDLDHPNCGRESLLNALIEASSLSESLAVEPAFTPEPRELGLGIGGIKNHLAWLVWAIFCRDLTESSPEEQVGQWVCEHPIDRLSLPISYSKPKLFVSQLEWFGDLLWHTFRFDAPMYPSPDDLAFQLSVSPYVPDSPPARKGPVGTVALLAEEQVRTELITTWLDQCAAARKKIKRNPSDFYEVIARSLAFQSRRVDLEAAGQESRGNAQDVVMEAKFVLGINTNLDLEIEESWLRAGDPFSIVLPIYVDYKRTGQLRSKPEWLLISVDESGEDKWELLGDIGLHRRKHELRGPLLIKIHGSPLLPLRSLEKLKRKTMSDDSSIVRLRHRLILSEYDFLREMLRVNGGDSLPPGLRNVLVEDERMLCFLGYPVSDSNSRLRLFDHVRSGSRPSLVLLVDAPRDPFHHAFLSAVDVRFVELKLENVAEVIDRASC